MPPQMSRTVQRLLTCFEKEFRKEGVSIGLSVSGSGGGKREQWVRRTTPALTRSRPTTKKELWFLKKKDIDK